MGSCFCFPVSSVTENPCVAMYTEVGRAIIMSPLSSIIMEKSIFDGIVYVIRDNIYYNSQYRGMFWCSCTSGSEWFVSDIRNIQVINKDLTLYNSRGPNWSFPMCPGLTISFRDNTALVVAMPDAVNFSRKLRHYQSNPSRMGNPSMLPNQFSSQRTTYPATVLPTNAHYNQPAARNEIVKASEITEIPEDSDKVALLA